MANNIGVIKQYKGPFTKNDIINLTGNACKIGISIAEDDFMNWGATYNSETGQWYGKDFIINIKGQQIHMGRTYIYQTQQAVNQPIPISFPDGAPTSLIIDVVYSSDYEEEEK